MTKTIIATENEFEPFRDTLYRFAKENQLIVNFQAEEIRWDDPHFELGWSLPSLTFVRMYFSLVSDDEYHLHVCKWDKNGKMIKKGWHITRNDTVTSFRARLEEAKDWAEED